MSDANVPSQLCRLRSCWSYSSIPRLPGRRSLALLPLHHGPEQGFPHRGQRASQGSIRKDLHHVQTTSFPIRFPRHVLVSLILAVLLLMLIFSYFFFPGFIFQALSYFSWMVWISPDNVALAAITSPLGGLGLNPIPTFDWNIMSIWLTPLTIPTFTIMNQFVGLLVIIPM